jgi:hypothetical protein
MNKNKLLLSAIALSIMTPVIVAPVQTNAAVTNFSDVSKSYYAHKEVMDLVNRGVINGYSDGTFKPTKQVTRAEFATFVARALDLPSATSSFKDVPKTSALYDGVSKAHKSGIIKGFSNATFKPNVAVSRQDMAVMLDRAMQLKGSYTKTKALNFSDKATVGAYAKTSVERLLNYNVMGTYSGTSYKPTTIGTRAETARFIYNMLTVVEEGTIVTPTPPPASSSEIEAIKKKDPLELTYSEIIKAYGPYVITRRFDLFNQVRGIQQWDIWKDVYMNYLKNAKEYNYKTVLSPDKWLVEEKNIEFGLLANLFGEVSGSYPNYEMIAVNGVPFNKSELMFGNNLANYNSFIKTERGGLLAIAPSETNQFKIDVHYKKHDFATYYKDSIGTGKQIVLPYTKDNKSLMVDVKVIFSDVPQVKVTSNSITYNGNTLKFANGSLAIDVNGTSKTLSVSPELKSNVQMVPIREISEYLGLTTRVSIGHFKKIEIQNYDEIDLIEIYR